MTSGYASHWIDITDLRTFNERYGFDPYLDLPASGIVSGFPDTYDRYLTNVRQLWQYGIARMREALQTAKNSKVHIRNMDNRNTYPDLREAMGR